MSSQFFESESLDHQSQSSSIDRTNLWQEGTKRLCNCDPEVLEPHYVLRRTWYRHQAIAKKRGTAVAQQSSDRMEIGAYENIDHLSPDHGGSAIVMDETEVEQFENAMPEDSSFNHWQGTTNQTTQDNETLYSGNSNMNHVDRLEENNVLETQLEDHYIQDEKRSDTSSNDDWDNGLNLMGGLNERLHSMDIDPELLPDTDSEQSDEHDNQPVNDYFQQIVSLQDQDVTPFLEEFENDSFPYSQLPTVHIPEQVAMSLRLLLTKINGNIAISTHEQYIEAIEEMAELTFPSSYMYDSVVANQYFLKIAC
ncbi:hypothetical protein EDC01DRAFT_628292 [Geopyxis carbonaria]|nr:hypothetical protein EDC01DRAFT_628292 [Geopyxis carbonaria]